MELGDQVRESFPFLFQEQRFAIVDANNRTIVVAESRDLRIRFISDRADLFIDVGSVSAPDVWTPVYDVLDALKNARKIEGGYKYSNKIGPLRSVLKKHLAAAIAHVNRERSLAD